MVIYGTVLNERWHRCPRGCFNAPGRCYFNSARPEVRPWEVRFAHPWRSKARLPIHIAMGGYASHGRTSVWALK